MSTASRVPGESVMAGGGYYSSHSKVQAAAAAPGFPFLERAARQVPIAAPTPVVIGDFGCAGGRNELEPIRIAIAAIRARSGVPIMVVHTDLPSNDFTSLFQAVERSDHSYLTGSATPSPMPPGARSTVRSFPIRPLHWDGPRSRCTG